MKSFSQVENYFGKGDKDSPFPKGAKVHHLKEAMSGSELNDYADTAEKIVESQNRQAKQMNSQRVKGDRRS